MSAALSETFSLRHLFREQGLDGLELEASRDVVPLAERGWDVSEALSASVAAVGDAREASPLDPCANSKEFVDRYGLRIDGRRFDWTAYPHMIDPYEDDHNRQVFMAGAQTGKTARLMVLLLRSAILRWGGLFGYYFPDLHLPGAFSKERFRPFVSGNETLAKYLGAPTSKGKGTDRTLSRSFGPSTFFFLSVGGKSMTEGLPMAGVFFDEVRRMALGDVQRAEERTSAQINPVDIKVSTAKYPESDIHHYFLQGDQRHFHTACDCPGGVVLSLKWPDCVVDMTRPSPEFKRKVAHAFSHAGLPYLGLTDAQRQEYGEAVYLCPDCGKIIVDPRDGWWEPHNPSAYVHSWQMPQILAPTWPAARILQAFNSPKLDVAEFWNSKLGLPYLDSEAQPVKPEHLAACVNKDLVWPLPTFGEEWCRRNLANSFMGIDAMGGYNCIVIKQRAPNGKARTIHLEVSHGDNPWKRCAELMEIFDVRCCVSDCNPHWNEARRFAKAFPGRVWLCNYVEESGTKGRQDMISWLDRKKAPAGQKGREAKFKYRVTINKAQGLKWSLGRWELRHNEVPNPRTLIQSLPVQGGKVILAPGLALGRMEPVRICETVYFLHQQRVVFRVIYGSSDNPKAIEAAKRRGEFKVIAEHIGLDPHFAHSDLYANMAYDRFGHSASPRQA